jgi:two-component sensor histidine kinase/integral membrane sensor domain MASE1
MQRGRGGVQTDTRNDWFPVARHLPALGLLTLAYTAAAAGGLQWTVVPGAGTALWPASGIAFAGLMLGGLRFWPAVLVGRLLAAVIVSSPQPWWADVWIAAATTLGVTVPVWMIRNAGGLDLRLGRLTDMVRLIGLGGVGGALLSGVLATAAVGVSGTAPDRLLIFFESWTFGFAVGVMVVAPAILAWWRANDRAYSPLQWLHLGVCLAAVGLVASLVFSGAPDAPFRTWHLFPVLVWAALAFSVQGASLALIITSGLGLWGTVHGFGPMAIVEDTAAGRLLIAQQFAAASGVTVLILAAVADERRGRARLAQSEARLRAETEALEILNATGALIAAELDQETVVQKVTDAGVALTGAEFGAFFYNVIREDGGAYTLYTLSGAPRAAFENFGMPRDTEVFHPTFAGTHNVRSDDITKDPRYGKMSPHFGMPQGHLPVRSYLAVPVKSRSGEVLGGLFFGHSTAGIFDERAERIIAGIGAQAAIAIDNARLYQAAQREITERRRAEEHQRLLINELNHRVKNTLATVQSIAAQTSRSVRDPMEGYDAFIARLMALSRAHDVLTRQSWEGADLAAVVQGAVTPFGGPNAERFRISGPSVWLEPQTALALAMALHELGTNASKYGALSTAAGRVEVDWTVRLAKPDALLSMCWRETGGPKVTSPKRKGFGSRLLERGLPQELDGKVDLDYRATGLVCMIEARLPGEAGVEEKAAEPA